MPASRCHQAKPKKVSKFPGQLGSSNCLSKLWTSQPRRYGMSVVCMVLSWLRGDATLVLLGWPENCSPFAALPHSCCSPEQCGLEAARYSGVTLNGG